MAVCQKKEKKRLGASLPTMHLSCWQWCQRGECVTREADSTSCSSQPPAKWGAGSSCLIRSLLGTPTWTSSHSQLMRRRWHHWGQCIRPEEASSEERRRSRESFTIQKRTPEWVRLGSFSFIWHMKKYRKNKVWVRAEWLMDLDLKCQLSTPIQTGCTVWKVEEELQGAVCNVRAIKVYEVKMWN